MGRCFSDGPCRTRACYGPCSSRPSSRSPSVRSSFERSPHFRAHGRPRCHRPGDHPVSYRQVIRRRPASSPDRVRGRVASRRRTWRPAWTSNASRSEGYVRSRLMQRAWSPTPVQWRIPSGPVVARVADVTDVSKHVLIQLAPPTSGWRERQPTWTHWGSAKRAGDTVTLMYVSRLRLEGLITFLGEGFGRDPRHDSAPS